MATAGCPVSESVPLELTPSAQSLLDTSKIQTQENTEPMGHGPSPVTMERFPSTEMMESCSGRCVAPKASVTDMHTLPQNSSPGMSAASDSPQSVKAAALLVHSSHSDTSPLPAKIPLHTDSQAKGLARPASDRTTRETEGHSMLACKQPMQLQQCNIVTTVCRGTASGEVGAQCMCCLFPRAVDEKCYGSLINHANFEDTFAAYCHPQPIPAPSQLLPHLAGVEASCDVQRTPLLTATDCLTPPRLISSVSETGLDTKHLLQCCSIGCSLMSSLPLGPAMQTPKHYVEEEHCSCASGCGRTMTQDMGTMTNQEHRDVGVQTGESESVTPHVFPQICLAEGRSETSSTQTPNVDSNAGQRAGGVPKTPVKEVKWDAEGMTWEVYGASVDPEELGLAIQRHLELQIKETASRAAKLSRQNTNTSRQSGNAGCQNEKSRRMRFIRAPACCNSSTTAVD